MEYRLENSILNNLTFSRALMVYLLNDIVVFTSRGFRRHRPNDTRDRSSQKRTLRAMPNQYDNIQETWRKKRFYAAAAAAAAESNKMKLTAKRTKVAFLSPSVGIN